MYSLSQIEYHLPAERIAHSPAEPRDHSRLLHLQRETGTIAHHHFYDLPQLLNSQDVIVRNNTKVLPARIFGQKTTGGNCELLLLRQVASSPNSVSWECLTKPGLKLGQELLFTGSSLTGICEEDKNYTRIINFSSPMNQFLTEIFTIGHTPIPPYIEWEAGDENALRQLYQTTYAKVMGSVAAPTAGLHFTPELDTKLRDLGIQIEEVTLHVGLGTFLPVQESQLQTGKLHSEVYILEPDVAERLNQAKQNGKKIVAVGTTTTRVLESCADAEGMLSAGQGETELFIQPGDAFRCVDKLITNFHLPKSSLLFLVSAFVSEPNTHQPFTDFLSSSVGQAYQQAIKQEYRFYSFGDAMLIE